MRSGDDNMQTCGLNDDGITRAIVADWYKRCQDVRMTAKATRTNPRFQRCQFEFTRPFLS